MAADDQRITEDESGHLVVTTPLLTILDKIQHDLSAGFATVQTSLRGKADKSDVARLETRLDDTQRRLGAVEAWKHDRELAGGVHRQRDNQVFSRRQKIWGSVGIALMAAASVAGGILSGVLSSGHHP